MKDKKLNPFEMDDQELEVFVRTILNGDKFNFDARTDEERAYNASIMERFNEYIPTPSTFGSCMITSHKGDLVVQVLGVKSFSDSSRNINRLEIGYAGWGTVGIIKSLIKSSTLFQMMEIKSKYQ